MKLCFSTLGCPDWTLERIIDAAASFGFAGIDFRGIGSTLDITTLPEFTTDAPRTRSRLQERALSIPCLNTSIALATADPEKWQAMLDEAARHGHVAGTFGTPLLRVFGGRVPPGLSRSDARAMAHRHLRQLLKILSPHRVMPVIESHDDWITSGQLAELLEPFTPRQVGVLWDVEHPYRAGQATDDFLATMLPWIRHVHLKDSLRETHRNRPVLPGEGDVPFGDCVRRLRKSGYDGWYCYELEKRWHKDAPEPEQALPRFVAEMQPLLC